jgi:predicted enzyme related to lactoylglutathione lyase
MNTAEAERKNYEMPPHHGFSIAHFLTVADIQRSLHFYEAVFGGSILNIRVANIQACYELWRSRGAKFITEPKDKYGETRCYIRDPDGYIIEVGQSKSDLAYG